MCATALLIGLAPGCGSGIGDQIEEAQGAGQALCGNFTVPELEGRFRVAAGSGSFAERLSEVFYEDVPDDDDGRDIRENFAGSCAAALERVRDGQSNGQ